MQIPRIYHPDLLSVDSEVILLPEAAHHLLRVLRLKVDHPIILFNGDGNEYSARLSKIEKSLALAHIDTQLSINLESPLSLHLGQSISKGDRMEFVIQKSVELGVTEITPLVTERTIVKLDDKRWQKKHHQWQKLVISACEQCGRNVVPVIHPTSPLNTWIGQSTNKLRLALHPKGDLSCKQISLSHSGAKLLIGPEGGLSDNEIYQVKQSGFQTMHLGSRILRTETAALTAIASLQALFGDFW
jgi:16S rRNA (uracil1498-N3)-methyltransferase